MDNLSDLKDLFASVRSKGKTAYLYMPHIFRKVTYDYFKIHAQESNSIFNDDNLNGYIIRNLEEYSFIKEYLNDKLANKEIITDYNLYIMNEEAAKFWATLVAVHCTIDLIVGTRPCWFIS